MQDCFELALDDTALRARKGLTFYPGILLGPEKMVGSHLEYLLCFFRSTFPAETSGAHQNWLGKDSLPLDWSTRLSKAFISNFNQLEQ